MYSAYRPHPMGYPGARAPGHVPMDRKAHKRVARSHFTIKNIILNGLLISFLFFVNRLGAPGSLLCYGILFYLAWSSVDGAIKAMSLSAMIIIGNQFLIDINIVHTLFRFPLIAVAGAKIYFTAFNHAQHFFKTPHFVILIIFGAVCATMAAINQYYFMISFLKLGVFVYGAAAILLATEMQRSSGSDLTTWFCSIAIFFIGANAIAFVLGLGYHYRGIIFGYGGPAGFAGMTNHPQTQGVFAAITFVYASSVFLFTPYRNRWIMGLLAPVALISCYMSAARTGLFAAVIAVGLLVGMAALLRTGPRRIRFNLSAIQVLAVIFFGVIGLFLLEFFTGGGISTRIADFALKAIRGGDGEGFSLETMFETRIALMTNSWQIFLANPIAGINFGTSLDPKFIKNAGLFTAPTEKGFLPTAILEETGLIGASIFWAFIFAFYAYYFKRANIMALAMMTVFLLLNLGEMMFFALGGMGLFCWCMLGAGISLGDRCLEGPSAGPPMRRPGPRRGPPMRRRV